jgi:D-tagatose-1,6-bisphosphate aldolase subunit GatZ/KbaZ
MQVRSSSIPSTNHPLNAEQRDARAWFESILRRNREFSEGGTYAVCSGHTAVLQASIQQCVEDGSILHVESTSSQVNQFGGYTGLTPSQFASSLRSVAECSGLPADRLLLGGDHLGPFPWRNEPSDKALAKACQLVRDCVTAGYQKIHLDASMACADDSNLNIPEELVAERAAILCSAAEDAFTQMSPRSTPPLYVVGTEVPAPGGESNESGAPSVTPAEHVHRTLETFRTAFVQRGQSSAWERVIAIVVQPGVDFGSDAIFDYDPGKAHQLSTSLSNHPGIVFEAHSTDYQSPHALSQLVRDHFAILKVGPWLTFAYREAILALSAIERELYGAGNSKQTSRVREVLEAVMLRETGYWKSYYHGDKNEVRRNLIYGLSDRCRYYWNQPEVQQEVARLFENLRATVIPLALVSQYLPQEYEAIRRGDLNTIPQQIVEYHIRRVLRIYKDACSVTRPA